MIIYFLYDNNIAPGDHENYLFRYLKIKLLIYLLVLIKSFNIIYVV